MVDSIPEQDWRVFRELRTVALNRFCQRVLKELVGACSDAKQSSHERYLAVFKLIKKRDEELARAFDDFRRSTAVRQLARIQYHELLTEEEMSRFSQQTRDDVRVLCDHLRD